MQIGLDAHPVVAQARGATPALVIVVAAIVILGAVWLMQWAGYQPCELCFKERLPFYGSVPLGMLVAWLAIRGRTGLLPAGYAALGLVFLCGAALGIYHTGVEWHFWPGPSSCTGSVVAPAGVDDFLKQLQTTQVVRCDAPALRVVGLSLAAWNSLACLALVGVAAYGFVTADRSRP